MSLVLFVLCFNQHFLFAPRVAEELDKCESVQVETWESDSDGEPEIGYAVDFTNARRNEDPTGNNCYRILIRYHFSSVKTHRGNLSVKSKSFR